MECGDLSPLSTQRNSDTRRVEYPFPFPFLFFFPSLPPLLPPRVRGNKFPRLEFGLLQRFHLRFPRNFVCCARGTRRILNPNGVLTF
jgi:hypothetical protein